MTTPTSLSGAPLNWTVPAIPALNNTRYCEYTAPWLATRDDTITGVITMMDSICNTTDQKFPTGAQWLEWYLSDVSNATVSDLSSYTIEYCSAEFCRKLGWEGNSDLAGRGMMVTYWLEGGLACIYAIFIRVGARMSLSRGDGSRNGRGTSPRTMMQSMTSAVIGSAPGLLDSMVLFCVAMLAAALYSYAHALATKDGVTDAERISLLFMAVYSIFPPALVQSVMAPMQRKKFHIVQWCLICVLAILDCVLAAVAPSPSTTNLVYGRDWTNEQIYDQTCAASNVPMWVAMKAFEIIAPTAIAILATARLPWAYQFQKRKVEAFQSYLWMLPAVVSFSGIWVFMGIFAAYRSKQGQLSGESDKEREWGFGQILALAQWLPVLANFAYIFFYGLERGLSGSLPEGYVVVPVKNELHLSTMATTLEGELKTMEFKRRSDPALRSIAESQQGRSGV
ncbi:hypothetical protein EK21DRAFT_116127 [Setomelanomma holmii]|uniref:Uncharacterized protein n=1 Tax=Setomelanomma holmii TaxID=210430 RepID=A0A9P4H0P1_9PLEO|nr:hypothetical protein EK21DRAFT_116127 [Setomelanomma holmii]